ncbi:MAG TPA: von Willebrand factor type A domain-containing protein [Chitinophagaceae bacterium]|nr:von Willebrand factor type A domain-containing protein [Chitinophagaceae bacterium]
MKTLFFILIFNSFQIFVSAQKFYFRGEVQDEAGNLLPNVTVQPQRTGYLFKTGASGTFGIVLDANSDTLSFSLEGYCKKKILASADNYIRIKLKKLATSAVRKDKLLSLTKDLGREDQKEWYTGNETYASLLENHFVNAKRFPNTGMSLNVDRASYSNIRRFISLKSFVPPDAVRIEEMLNYFNLNYKEPDNGQLFNARTKISSCPWNPESQLFFVNLSSAKLDLDSLPPSHLVFLIDVSGSMDMPNRLPLLKSAFRLLVNNLRDKDSVAIVVYGGLTGVMLNTTSGAEKEKIFKAIDELEPGGATPGESGIKLAYSVARNHFIKGGNNRVILATDGDFNVGLKTENELDSLITAQKETGIYLTCLGVGMGNYKDSKIQTLAQNGNGNFSYLDNYNEAEKVLLKEFTQTLYSVADGVYMNVEFNPDYVKEYRLIGFDNKVGALRDSLSMVEGGEIGSGHSMMAMFEIIPTEKNIATIKNESNDVTVANIKLTYNLPRQPQEYVFNYRCLLNFSSFDQLDKSYRFSTAVSMFGALLRESKFIRNTSFDDILKIGTTAINTNDLSQKEFLNLVDQAKKLYSKTKKKKEKEKKDRQSY